MKYLILLLLLTGCAHKEPIVISPEAAQDLGKMMRCETAKDAEERKECE
jgi:hypothetical protein